MKKTIDNSNTGSNKTGVSGINKAVNNSASKGSLMSYLGFIWLTGASLMFLYILVVNIRFNMAIRRLTVCNKDGIIDVLNKCKSEMAINSKVLLVYTTLVKTPSLYGIFWHRILIPKEVINKLSAEENRYVLLHELAHLKRKDILVNWLTILIQTMHWFNPVIWYAFYKMRQDGEVACDSYVLSKIEPREYKNYGETLLDVLQAISRPYWATGTTGMTNSKKGIKERIARIAKFKKKPVYWTVIAVVLVGVIGFVGLTNSKIATKSNKTTKSVKDDTVHKSNNKKSNKKPGNNVTENKSEVVNFYGNTSGNLNNRGQVAKQGDWIYYTSYSLKDNRMVINKMKSDGSKIQRLYTSSNLYGLTSINVVGDWVYFLDGFIYKIKTDGTEKTQLGQSLQGFFVVGDWLYYIDDLNYSGPSKLTKKKVDGTELQVLSDGYKIIGLDKDFVYFLDKGGIYKIRNNGNEKKQIHTLKDYSGAHALLKDNWIYFVDNDGPNHYIDKIQTDGSNFTRLTSYNTQAVDINIEGDWIFYTKWHSTSEWPIYKIKSDGTSDTKITDISSEYLNIFDEWIYFETGNSVSRKLTFYKMKLNGSNLSERITAQSKNNIIKNEMKLNKGTFDNLKAGDNVSVDAIEFIKQAELSVLNANHDVVMVEPTVDNNYKLLPPYRDSQDKVKQYLQNYWSPEMTDKIIKNLDLKVINGKLYIRVGDYVPFEPSKDKTLILEKNGNAVTIKTTNKLFGEDYEVIYKLSWNGQIWHITSREGKANDFLYKQ